MGVAASRHQAAPGQIQQRCHLVAPGGSSKLRGATQGATHAECSVVDRCASGLMNLRRNNGVRDSSSLAFFVLSSTSSVIAGFTARPAIAVSA